MCAQGESLKWISKLGYVCSTLLLVGCASAAAGGSNSRLGLTSASIRTDRRAQISNVRPFASDDEQLRALWQSRFVDARENAGSGAFALGPGDIVHISVPLIEPLRDRTVRVSELNTISLPLIGDINLGGMSEEDLRNELNRRLRKYMYQPEVEVLLQQTENREVAVLGAVAKPGRYTLASKSDTLMTMISRAGGMNQDAASRVILIPTSRTGKTDGDRRSVEADGQGLGTAHAPAFSESAMHQAAQFGSRRPASDQCVIRLTRADEQRYLELPARPGDTIIIPAAGQVTVQGWVDKPGAFPITPGMTALSAIAAAGGAQFSSSATLVREREDGGKADLSLDLSKVKRGSQADVPVQAGDVVIVEPSVIGMVPYSFYFLANHIGFGLFPAIP